MSALSSGKIDKYESLTVENTAWKVYRYGVSSGSYFVVFELNKEIYEDFPVFSEYGKIRTMKKNPYLDIFHTVKIVNTWSK